MIKEMLLRMVKRTKKKSKCNERQQNQNESAFKNLVYSIRIFNIFLFGFDLCHTRNIVDGNLFYYRWLKISKTVYGNNSSTIEIKRIVSITIFDCITSDCAQVIWLIYMCFTFSKLTVILNKNIYFILPLNLS